MNTCGWSLDKARCDHQLLRVWLGTEEYGAGGAVTSGGRRGRSVDTGLGWG